MYRITGIKVSSKPPRLDVITDYLFAGQDGEGNAWFTKAEGVSYVRDHYHQVWVAGATASAWVEVVNATPPYLRTEADGTTSDNLLSLPVY